MPHVLRFRRVDRPADFVLVSLKQNGPAALDLKLVGTDGESPFVVEIKASQIQSLRSSNYHADHDDWVSVLSSILLQQQQQADAEVVQGSEAVASVTADSITLSIRKNISGITQRLGTITLNLDEDEPIELFDWAGHAAQSTDEVRDQLVAMQASMASEKLTVERLTADLDALVKAKKDHEEELLQKFAALLNTKKLKIRDQQRLLANAKIDPKAAAQVQQTRSAPIQKPGPSRASKRKANVQDSETDDSEEGLELLGDEAANPTTPEESEAETDTDAEGFDPAPAVSQKTRRGASQGKTMGSGPQEATASTASPPPPTEWEPVMGLPPRRELPFTRKTETKPTSQPKQPSHSFDSSATPAPSAKIATNSEAIGEDDETDSDDEL